MATTFHDGFAAPARRSVIDLPVAALAAASVGFVSFAMPGDLLSNAVSATGLPTIIPAAAPPLGATARALVAAAAVVATFGIVFLLLRLLDRKPAEPARAPASPFVADDEDFEHELPRLRRADSHPDAPARRPILAGRELGEPDLAKPPETAAPEPDPAPTTEFLQLEPEIEPEPLPEPEPEPEPAPPVAAAPRAPAPVQEPLLVGDSSIGDLVTRLERGLGRRKQAPAGEPEPARPQAPAHRAEDEAPEARDNRLTSAIENLQRLASRAG